MLRLCGSSLGVGRLTRVSPSLHVRLFASDQDGEDERAPSSGRRFVPGPGQGRAEGDSSSERRPWGGGDERGGQQAFRRGGIVSGDREAQGVEDEASLDGDHVDDDAMLEDELELVLDQDRRRLQEVEDRVEELTEVLEVDGDEYEGEDNEDEEEGDVEDLGLRKFTDDKLEKVLEERDMLAEEISVLEKREEGRGLAEKRRVTAAEKEQEDAEAMEELYLDDLALDMEVVELREKMDPTWDHLEAVAEKIARSEEVDPLDLDAMKRYIDRKPFVKTFPEGRTWQEEARVRDEEFKQLGLENPADVWDRMQEAQARGLQPNDKDVEFVSGYMNAEENPALWAIGESTFSQQQVLHAAHDLYEEASLMLHLEGEKNAVDTMGVNKRVNFGPAPPDNMDDDEEDDYEEAQEQAEQDDEVDEEKLMDDYLLPEDLDEEANLPMERNPSKDAADAKKCEICWCRNQAPELHPLNVHLLREFLNVEGRLLPRRQTKLCAKFQRKVAKTVRRAKHLGVLSFKQGAFALTDPFVLTQTPRQYMEEAGRAMWYRLKYPEPFPGLDPKRQRDYDSEQSAGVNSGGWDNASGGGDEFEGEDGHGDGGFGRGGGDGGFGRGDGEGGYNRGGGDGGYNRGGDGGYNRGGDGGYNRGGGRSERAEEGGPRSEGAGGFYRQGGGGGFNRGPASEGEGAPPPRMFTRRGVPPRQESAFSRFRGGETQPVPGAFSRLLAETSEAGEGKKETGGGSPLPWSKQ